VREYYVYILASMTHVLYTGVTNDLAGRVYAHRQYHPSSFTSRYQIHQLVYWETISDPRDAIAREKQLKSWRQDKKIALIESTNPEWRDLSDGWFN
jgi:putative endonuclease